MCPRKLQISRLGGPKAHDLRGVPSKTTLEVWARVTSDPASERPGAVSSRPGPRDGRPVLPGAPAF